MVALRSALLVAALLSSALAHTTFTNFYIDGQSVTPGKCVRMPQDPAKATNPLPVSSIVGNDIACGVDGDKGVEQTCDVNPGSILTFNFRACPEGTCDNGAKAVPIDVSHRGTCAVYMKHVNNASESNNAAGPGWFKIFQHDYDGNEKKWCTDKIIDSGGLLSAKIPGGLQGGDYLIRTEILALHQADKSPPDPQFYVGCAQTHIKSSGSDVPVHTVSIPGYVSMQNNPAALKYHVWDETLVLPFPSIGPPVYTGAKYLAKLAVQSNQTTTTTASATNCIIENGNWCGTEVPSFSDDASCATSHTNCWAQSADCYNTASLAAVGHTNCTAWDNYCVANDNVCSAGTFPGPAKDALKVAPALASITPPPVLAMSLGSSPSANVSSSTEPSNSATTSTSLSTASPTSSTLQSAPGSIDACGARNNSAVCSTGMCCSSHGYCGTSIDYCGDGCQSGFGSCPGTINKRSVRLHAKDFRLISY